MRCLQFGRHESLQIYILYFEFHGEEFMKDFSLVLNLTGNNDH